MSAERIQKMRHGDGSVIIFICLVFLCSLIIVERLNDCTLQFSFGYDNEPTGLTCEIDE